MLIAVYSNLRSYTDNKLYISRLVYAIEDALLFEVFHLQIQSVYIGWRA